MNSLWTLCVFIGNACPVGCLLAELLCVLYRAMSSITVQLRSLNRYCCDSKKMHAHVAGSREMCLFQCCGSLPSMEMLVPLLLRTMILRNGDVEHSPDFTAKISDAAAERFKKAGWVNFDKYGRLCPCCMPCPSVCVVDLFCMYKCGSWHQWEDILGRFPLPSNLQHGSDEAGKFKKRAHQQFPFRIDEPHRRYISSTAQRHGAAARIRPNAAAVCRSSAQNFAPRLATAIRRTSAARGIAA